MRKLQSRLTIALLFTALAIITFFVTAFISGPISFIYRDAAGLSSARNIAQIVALLALVVLFITGFIITIPIAFQPANWLGKIGKILPIYLLLFALAAVGSALIGVGQVGNLLNIQGIGAVSFIAAWLGLAAIISTIGVAVGSTNGHLSLSTVKSATRTTAAASGLTAVAAIAMLASVVIVSTSTPSAFGGPGGLGGQFPGGSQGGNRPGAAGQTAPNQNNNSVQGQQPEATGEPQAFAPNGQNGSAAPSGQSGQRAEGTGEPQAQGGFPGGGNGGRPEGGFPPGGPGGPGGGSANVAGRYAVGGGLMALFAVIGLISGVSGLVATRQVTTPSTSDSSVIVNVPRQAGLALLMGLGVTIIVIGLIQLVPVTRDNPPVKTPINWDSEQTKKLVYATCMDCHSNETTWPWYATIAPSSWLTVMHVKDGRQELNLSEMDSMLGFRRQNLAENMAEQIRSGNMPPKDYLILHPDARLTDAQKEELIQGLQKSLSGS